VPCIQDFVHLDDRFSQDVASIADFFGHFGFGCRHPAVVECRSAQYFTQFLPQTTRVVVHIPQLFPRRVNQVAQRSLLSWTCVERPQQAPRAMKPVKVTALRRKHACK
jgi:hypothetical protein